MNRRLRISIFLFEALLLLFAVYFEPTCNIRGRLWGEAFFDGKSTSWWREELSRWEVAHLMTWASAPATVPFFYRTPTWLERWNHWNMESMDDHDTLGPTLLRGDHAALPVLQELRADGLQPLQGLVDVGLKNAGGAP